MPRPSEPWLAQFAFSVADLPGFARLCCEGLGFVRANALMPWGPALGRIQGLPGDPTAMLWWLVDRQESVQLELWQYSTPTPRPRRRDWRPSDTGYARLALWVADLEKTTARLQAAGLVPIAATIEDKRGRRVCFRMAEGLVFELMEEDAAVASPRPPRRPEIPVAARAVALSVPDLECARRFWGEGLGATELPGFTLHPPETEALWGLPGAACTTAVFRAGDVLIELCQYERPEPRPWPDDYLLSDLGFLNVAMSYRDRAQLQATYDHLLAMGYTANVAPAANGPFASTYVTDDQGFSVELFYSEPELDRLLGFEPERTFRDVAVPGHPW
ncbi:MAG: VOC family protein [Dehalococcoidia bacterium]|nr:VOC family protein [Dehalococcoidia bacterium]